MSDTTFTVPELGDNFIDYRMPIWGNSYTWSWERPITQVQYVVIHHTVTSSDATPDDIALLHKARGWGGIGYHFIITKDGKVWYVGDIGTARAHVANMNEKVLGVSLVGDFTKGLPSDEQITSAHKLCKFFIDTASICNITSWENIVGHKELTATACPGSSWNKSVSGDMWWRIKSNTVYSAPPPQQDDVYKITYKGEVLATYEKNPEDKIEELDSKLKAASDEVSRLTSENATLTSSLNQQEKDNADLLTQLRESNSDRDKFKIEATNLGRQLDVADGKIKTQGKTIEALKSQDPLKGFTGWQLIGEGISKLVSRK